MGNWATNTLHHRSNHAFLPIVKRLQNRSCHHARRESPRDSHVQERLQS